jgi:hypothetical protein
MTKNVAITLEKRFFQTLGAPSYSIFDGALNEDY